jgi:hypothetical protein
MLCDGWDQREKETYGLAVPPHRGLTSDMAITANEHVDLRLTDLSVRVDELKDQLGQVRRILKEVD